MSQNELKLDQTEQNTGLDKIQGFFYKLFELVTQKWANRLPFLSFKIIAYIYGLNKFHGKIGAYRSILLEKYFSLNQ